VAGKTSLPALVELLGSSALVLTTDSGPAHVSNAMQTHTIVLFGAGNENNTAPFNKDKRTIIRLGKLSCEPCVSNTCKQFGIPECLIQLDENLIASTIVQLLKSPANVI
jgi:ADP-heptose:LPS heptosyltransferase